MLPRLIFSTKGITCATSRALLYVTSVACTNCKYGVSLRAFLREFVEKVVARAKQFEEEEGEKGNPSPSPFFQFCVFWVQPSCNNSIGNTHYASLYVVAVFDL